MMNALVGRYAGGDGLNEAAAPRALVSPRRHTTRDSVEADLRIRLEADGNGVSGPAVDITVLDTAGSARRGAASDELAAEVARVRTRALGGATEVAVVVVDVSAPAGGPTDEPEGVPSAPADGHSGPMGWRGGVGLTRGEATGLREAWRRGLAVVVAATKADRLRGLRVQEIGKLKREVELAVARALPEAAGTPVVLCSAPPEVDLAAGAEVDGLEALIREVAKLRARRAHHAKTSRLNRWWRKVQSSDEAPPEANRVRFLAQTGSAPPIYAVFARPTGRQARGGGEILPGSTLRWLRSRLRDFGGLQGVPFELDVRLSGGREAGSRPAGARARR